MTLRNAQAGEESILLNLAGRDPLFNLFLLSNLTRGLSTQVEAWVQDGIGVLMRRGGNWMVDPGPDPARFDFESAAEIVDSVPAELRQGMTGRPNSVDPLIARLKHRPVKVHEEFFAALHVDPSPAVYAGAPRPARAADLDALVDIYANADDMSRSPQAVEQMLPTLWVVEDDHAIRTAGNFHAETAQAGMIGAVFTPHRHRRKGYATTLVHGMSQALVHRGKTACLFYHNPVAGKIYLGLGYQPISAWRMIRF